MFINTLDSPSHKLQQLLHTLKHVHQFEFVSREPTYLQEAHEHYQSVQDQIVTSSAFNSYHSNPEYTKAALITEAVKMLLEIAPKRRKKSAVEESKKKHPKPDFLDVDHDGDKQESFKKAVADKAQASKLDEKWGTKMKTAPKDMGKWDGWTIAELKARKKKLMDKEDRTAAQSKEVRQINFAIRAKQQDSFGKIKQESMLMEDENLDKAETLLAAKDLSDRLQNMAEDAAKMAVDRLMPLVDIMKSQFGQEPADGFNSVVKAQLQTVLDTIIAAKDQTDNAILSLQGGQIPSQAGIADISQPLPGSELPAQQPVTGPVGGQEEFTATPATAGPAQEPLGRSMKEPMAETIQVGDNVQFAFVKGMTPLRGTVLEFVKVRKTQENHYGYMVDIRSDNVIYSVHPDHAQKLMEGSVPEFVPTPKKGSVPTFVPGNKKPTIRPTNTSKHTPDNKKDQESAEQKQAPGGRDNYQQQSFTDFMNMFSESKKTCMECGQGSYMEADDGKLKCTECGHLISETALPSTTQQLQNMATKGKDANGKPLTPQQKQAAKKAANELAKANLEEKLTKKMTAGEIISDFLASDDPKFQGKSKAERTKMALGAYYSLHPEKSKQQESLNNLKAVVESLTTEYNNLRVKFSAHKQEFQYQLNQGLVQDILNEGYGLQGAAILEQIKLIKQQLKEKRQQLQQISRDLHAQLDLDQKIIERAQRLHEQVHKLPYGIVGLLTDNTKFKKFFESEHARATWTEFNQSTIKESVLIDPQDLSRISQRLTDTI
jgi:ribosomal protein S27AE